MTDTNDLHVALLTELGWRVCEHSDPDPRSLWPPEIEVTTDKNGVMLKPGGPAYPVAMPPLDHNLIAQALGLLVNTTDQLAYIRTLGGKASSLMLWRPDEIWTCLNKSPDQHAAAILRALGKLPKDWRESTDSKPLIIP